MTLGRCPLSIFCSGGTPPMLTMPVSVLTAPVSVLPHTVQSADFIPHKVFSKSCCKNQLPHTSVNLSFTVHNKNNKLRDLSRNRLLQNDFKNTLCEIRLLAE